MESNPQPRPLSEISHLFLSNVRDLPKPGAPRPVRIPPGAPRDQARPTMHESVDLTPEEFAEVFGKIELDEDDSIKKPIVLAVLGSHLAGNQADKVRGYARHYAVSSGYSVGMIEVDASEFRLMRFEPGIESHANEDGTEAESFDPRHMAEVIEEMNVDVDRWLLHVVNPRLPEARTLLRAVSHWVMLSTCDHDGVVSCYRTLKGLADLQRPRLSLALLDAPTAAEATVIYRKLSSVCQQFLNWPLEYQQPVRPATQVSESLLLNCRPLRDKAQLAAAPQWQIVADFLAHSQPEPMSAEPSIEQETAALAEEQSLEEALKEEMPRRFSSVEQDKGSGFRVQGSEKDSVPMSSPRTPNPEPRTPLSLVQPVSDTGTSDVVDLPSTDSSPSTILSAIIRHTPGALVECPVRPPMCPEATLAVDREHGLVLLAVTKSGLTDLRSIAQAYQWLSQNRQLIGMAVPQFTIDIHRQPQLRLLVDHRDMTADLLQPMLEAGHVSVQAYRKLRWGDRMGLLLDAA